MPPLAPDAQELLRHASFVRGLVRQLVRDDASADDVLQDTWVRSIERPPRHGGNVRGWLGVVARNFALRSRRSETRRAARERRVARPESELSTQGVAELLGWQRRVVEAVEALEPRRRDLVVARFYEGLGPRQVAKRFGIEAGEASRLLDDALERLRAHLDQRSEGGRARWAMALLPLTTDPRLGAAALGTAAAGTVAAGGVVMGTKAAIVVAGLAVGAGSFWAGRATAPDPEPSVERDLVASAPPPASAAEPRLEGTTETAPSPPAGPAPANLTTDRSPEGYLRRIQAAPSAKEVGPIAKEIHALSPDEGWDVVRTIYGRVEPDEKRHALVWAFARTGHPHELDVLGLEARDADGGLAARKVVSTYAFLDLEDVEAYRAWEAENRGVTPVEALRRGVRSWVGRLRSLTGDELRDEVRRGRARPPQGIRAEELASALRDAGLRGLLDEWRTRPPENEDPNVVATLQGASIRLLLPLGLDDASYRAIVEPIVSGPAAYPKQLREEAFEVLGERLWDGAVDLLLRAFETTPNKSDWSAIAKALEEIRDPRALPVMVGMIVADGEYESVYGIGYFGLGKWLGVKYDKKHDGAWWADWWARNQEKLPPEVRGAPIPRLSPVARDR